MSDPDKHFSVIIESGGWEFEAPPAMSLLDAAARANIRLPSSCRNGTCRTCMCRMTIGRVRYRIEWPGLTREEKAEGFILPCVAYPESDMVIAVSGVTLITPAPGNKED